MASPLSHQRLFLGIILLTGLATACAVTGANYLRTNSADWNQWLDKVVDVSLVKVPVSEALQRGPFEDLHVVLKDIDGTTVISYEEEGHITRRMALYRLAAQYGWTMTPGDKTGNFWTLYITNKESSRENRPLP